MILKVLYDLRTRADKPKLSIFHRMHKFWARENIVHNFDDYQSDAAEAWKTMLKKTLKAHSACLGGTHIELACTTTLALVGSKAFHFYCGGCVKMLA